MYENPGGRGPTALLFRRPCLQPSTFCRLTEIIAKGTKVTKNTCNHFIIILIPRRSLGLNIDTNFSPIFQQTNKLVINFQIAIYFQNLTWLTVVTNLHGTNLEWRFLVLLKGFCAVVVSASTESAQTSSNSMLNPFCWLRHKRAMWLPNSIFDTGL